MSDVIIDVSSNKTSRINLGIQGENIVEHVIFNIASWIEEYGEGVAYVYAKRSGDLEPYPVALDMDMDAKTATWDVNLVDTAVKGRGSAQLVYVVDEDNEPDFSEDEVKKTKVFATTVQASLVVSSEENPEGYSTWLEVLGGYTVRVESAKAAAQAAQTAAQAAQAAAETAKTAAEAAQSAAETAEANAEASEDDAETAATNAATSETNAANSATSAAASASSASTSATAASNSATAASGSASTASTAATTATTKASEASASATSAAESASDASDSADAAAASAEAAAQSAASLTVDTELDDTSTNPVQNKAITAEITDLKEDLEVLNVSDIQTKRKATSTVSNITYTWDNTNRCYTISGTSSANSNYDLVINANRIVPTQSVYYLTAIIPTNATVEVYSVYNGNYSRITNLTSSGETVIYVPTNCDVFYVRFFIANGKTVNGNANAWVTKHKTNATLTSDINSIFNYEKELNTKLLPINAFDIQTKRTVTSTSNGITYTYDNSANDYNVTGTNNSGTPSFYNLVSDGNRIAPTQDKYYVTAVLSTDVYLDVYSVYNGNYTLLNRLTVSGSVTVIIPDNCDVFYVRFTVNNGKTVNGHCNAWVSKTMTNQGLTEYIDNPVEINNTYNSYTNTYNVTASPSITSDTNNYLAPTGDTTDRTNDIVTMLTQNGVCRLGKGLYYVTNLVMPDNTSLFGSGRDTEVVLSGTQDGFAISMGDYCSVSDMCITGKTPAMNGIAISETLGNRHGILWQGNYTQSQSSDDCPKGGFVHNVWITNFTGGGITCADTGYSTQCSLKVSNAFFRRCNAGINISYFSEFNTFDNCQSLLCYYGCINNGGNNVFVGCDFSLNTLPFLLDDQYGQSTNSAHGSAIGCRFHHADNNTGTGIKILGSNYGFAFNGCQMFFSKIEIENADGIMFTGCNFGATNQNITIDGGGAIIFNGCMWQAAPPITITNNQKVHFVNCYVASTGNAVSN